MMAQAVTGTPGHVNTMAESVGYFLQRFPLQTMQPGDHFITNDPWLASGHLHDITVVTPVFHRGRAVALFACCCHQVDIGGLGQGADGRSIFEEGLQIPPMRLMKRGAINEELLDLICQNVRTPYEVRGDIISYVTANESAARQLLSLLEEIQASGIDEFAAPILERSRTAVESSIAALPKGKWNHQIRIDGYDEPILLCAALTIGAREMIVDYTGSSPASPFGINVVLNYCIAYTAFALKCVVAPDVPNNAGSLTPLRVTAPEGSVLNARRPWPVSARHVVGQMLPDVVFGCLHQAVPGRVPAEGASCNWTVQLRRGPDQAGGGAPTFETVFFNCGGSGARPSLDGLSATAFPSGVKAMPVEVVEHGAPIVVWRKELRPGSGGAGQFRGGLGLNVEVGTRHKAPFSLLAMFERVENPPQGRAGGAPGAPGTLKLSSGARLKGKGLQQVPAGETLVLETPGGAGYGPPGARAPESAAEDARLELQSENLREDKGGKNRSS
jgi:N-methylhydantoinase B